RGVDVVRIGLCSTDGLYFASGLLGVPGAMFTASHNPAQYNGIKLCRAGARPVGEDTGLAQVRDLAERLLAAETPAPLASAPAATAATAPAAPADAATAPAAPADAATAPADAA